MIEERHHAARPGSAACRSSGRVSRPLSWPFAFSRAATPFSRNLLSVFDLTWVPRRELSAVAMRRMRGAAVVVTAMAIGRALIARVGLAFIRTILTPCFCFAGTLIVPALHIFTSSSIADGRGQRNNVQIYCHPAIASVIYDCGPPLAINPSESTQECKGLVPGRTNSFFSMSRKFYRGESTGDNSASHGGSR